MARDVIVRLQPEPVAQNTFPHIATLVICRSTVLHAGLRHILSGTRFALAHDVFGPTSDLTALAGSTPVLILLCESPSPDEYLETLERLKTHCPSAWVVVLADHLDATTVMRLFGAGLNGLCSPAMAGSRLINVLELVTTGETFLPAAVGLGLLEQQSCWSRLDTQAIVTEPAIGLAGRLSHQEGRILQCLLQGASNKVIARRLEITEATVKVHIKNIMKKIQAANRTQAAIWAHQHLPREIQHPV